MAKRILYFTKGKEVDLTESGEIAEIIPFTQPQYELVVMNGAENNEYGYGPIPGDYAAGQNIPTEFSGLTEFDPKDPPEPAEPLLPGTHAIIKDSDTFAVTGDADGTLTVTIADGVPTFTIAT